MEGGDKSCCRLCHHCFPHSHLCRSQAVASRRCRTCSCRRPPDIAFPVAIVAPLSSLTAGCCLLPIAPSTASPRPFFVVGFSSAAAFNRRGSRCPHLLPSAATTAADRPSRNGRFLPCVLLCHRSRLHSALLSTAPAPTIIFFMQENDAAPTALSFGLLCLFPCAKNYSRNPYRPRLRPSPSAPISRQQLAFLAAVAAISSSSAPPVVATFSAESSPSSPAAPLLIAGRAHRWPCQSSSIPPACVASKGSLPLL
ncbi:hypothetical protein B296_00044704 [Ensete ventricosum]|uniref:Uncharacterized protein n=1 Tax=Ensete ventricosum TaxID=4639 RepID=A0A426ZA53_ENSVE|nr:hypothetical protein B296_00044704 [Ensete ventricosum]